MNKCAPLLVFFCSFGLEPGIAVRLQAPPFSQIVEGLHNLSQINMHELAHNMTDLTLNPFAGQSIAQQLGRACVPPTPELYPRIAEAMRAFPDYFDMTLEFIWDMNRCFTDTAKHCILLADNGVLDATVEVLHAAIIEEQYQKGAAMIDHIGRGRTFDEAAGIISKCARVNATHKEKLISIKADKELVNGTKVQLISETAAREALASLGQSG